VIVDLQERHQLDVSEAVHKVRAKVRPWRSIFALVIAVAGAIAAEVSGVAGWSGLHGADDTAQITFIAGAVAFFVFGMAASVGLSGIVRSTSQALVGQAHAGVLRYVIVLAGVFTVATVSLALARIDVKQLLVGGAVTGVLLGIAAQQSLANLFAGLVLLFARPFRVGDSVRFRAGAISGIIEGNVTDISLTYVRLETADGRVLLPNSQALAAAVQLVVLPPTGATSSGGWNGGGAVTAPVTPASGWTTPVASGPVRDSQAPGSAPDGGAPAPGDAPT
jgi:small-conductance mechanosensitive channel